MRIVFATNNQHKLSEIRDILGPQFEVLSLADIGCHDDIPETADTFEGNALQKAQYVCEHYHISCFADDSGLEVDALGGAPGVFSARYAGGQGHDSEANMQKLLAELGENNNRKARFRTAIALLLLKDGHVEHHAFDGTIDGTITKERRGTGGFGYDPIFQPDGYDTTFAELGNETKNKISHRARAVQQLSKFLTTHL